MSTPDRLTVKQTRDGDVSLVLGDLSCEIPPPFGVKAMELMNAHGELRHLMSDLLLEVSKLKINEGLRRNCTKAIQSKDSEHG